MVRSGREAGGVVAAYKTIVACAEAEIVEKKSRFIGQIAPVATEEEALAFIAEVKAAHRMARHNVYAYVLRGGRVRYTDDGEPAKRRACRRSRPSNMRVWKTWPWSSPVTSAASCSAPAAWCAPTPTPRRRLSKRRMSSRCRSASTSSWRCPTACTSSSVASLRRRREACRERLRRERPAHLPHARRHSGPLLEKLTELTRRPK